jgi:putative intracellular protease/amidase
VKILSIVSSAHIGFWLAELTHPYWHFTERGFEVDIASPEGGAVRPDPMSVPSSEGSWESDDLVSKGFLASDELAAKLNSTLKLAAVDVTAYDGVHVVGGAGPAVDMYPNTEVGDVLSAFWNAGKVVGTICHGSIVLGNIPDLVKGRRATGFSRAEDALAEEIYGKDFIPHFPQPTMEAAGIDYVHVEPWGVRVVVDGKLITGQNQQSASEYSIAYIHLLQGATPVLVDAVTG